MTADTTTKTYRSTSPRIVAGAAAYLRSAVAALLAVAAVFVASRRLASALGTPLGPLQLLVAAVLLAGLAQIAHFPSHKGQHRTGSLLVSLAMLVLAASLSLPGSNPIVLLGFWALIVGGELWAWRSIGERRAESGEQVLAASDSIKESEPTEPAADVLRQLTLHTTAEGGQELSGWLRMPLVAGQRTGSLHVAFCPSFGQMPQVQAEAVSGPDCRIKAAQILPYGARLDIKLDKPAREDESVLVWFHAASVS